MPFSFAGVIPAVWTPTGADGSLLKDAFRENLQFILRSGVKTLLILGSTGEFLQFTPDERKKILDFALENALEADIAVNISHTNPRVVADLARHARYAGANALTLLPPWFYPLSDEDLIAFYANASRVTDLPLALYNFPNLVGKTLTPEIIRALAKEMPMDGMKNSGGKFEDHKPLAELARELGFNLLTGWDTHIPEAMAMGAKGCVGGLGNFVPELMVEVYRLIASGRANEAAAPARALKQIGQIIDTLEFPNNVAAAMEARGLQPGVPKQILSAASRQKFNAVRDALQKLFAQLQIQSA